MTSKPSFVYDIVREIEKDADLEVERVLSSDKTVDSYTSQSVENEFVVLAISF